MGRFLAACRTGRVWLMFTTEKQNHTRKKTKKKRFGEEGREKIPNRRVESAGRKMVEILGTKLLK